jgi:hypothetical protein
VLKNMHWSINPEDIKMEIEKLEHSVTNIWNIKQYRTKFPLSMFFVELQPALNNKDIFNVKYIQQYKIQFEPPRYKETLPNMPTAKDTGTPKTTVTSNKMHQMRWQSPDKPVPRKRKIERCPLYPLWWKPSRTL